MYKDGHKLENLEEMDDFLDTVNYQNWSKNWKPDYNKSHWTGEQRVTNEDFPGGPSSG